jgi:glutathione S-transferase
VPAWTALVTVALVAEYYLFTLPIYAARRSTGIRAPAMQGHPDLDRAIRVHLNTLEKLLIVFPTLWIAAWTVGDLPAAVSGAAWGVSRVIYAVGYLRSARGRTLGALLGDVVEVGLLGLAGYGVVALLSS